MTEGATRHYLTSIYEAVTMDDEEYRRRFMAAAAMGTKLALALPFAADVIQYGSLTRRTSLSSRVSPDTDVDFLMVLSRAMSRELAEKASHKDTRGSLHWALEPMSARLASAGFDRIELDPPSVNVVHEGTKYQITPATAVEGEGDVEESNRPDRQTYVFMRPITQEVIDRQNYLSRYVGSGVTGGEGDQKEMITITDPLQLTRASREYDHFHGPRWRHLVGILKYWKLVSGAKLTSYELELNIVDALRDPHFFARCKTLFDVLYVFVAGSDVAYDLPFLLQCKEFARLRSFVKLARKAFYDDHDLPSALARLAEVIPPPEPIADFWYTDSEPAARVSEFLTAMRAVSRQLGLSGGAFAVAR